MRVALQLEHPLIIRKVDRRLFAPAPWKRGAPATRRRESRVEAITLEPSLRRRSGLVGAGWIARARRATAAWRNNDDRQEICVTAHLRPTPADMRISVGASFDHRSCQLSEPRAVRCTCSGLRDPIAQRVATPLHLQRAERLD